MKEEFTDFKALKLGPKPNQFLMAPPGHCLEAQPHLSSPVLEYDASELYSKIRDYSSKWKNVQTDDETLHVKAVAVTKLMRFKDDIDIEVIDAGLNKSTFAVYSRSRVGYGDMGANKKRVLALVRSLGAKAK